jgi:hypothetical protein
MTRQQASDFDQKVLDLYDDFAHGRISRRDFAQRAASYLAAGMTAESLLASLSPNYAWAQQVPSAAAVTARVCFPRTGAMTLPTRSPVLA